MTARRRALALRPRDRTLAAVARLRAACRPARGRPTYEGLFAGAVHLDRDHPHPGRNGRLDLWRCETGGAMKIEKRGMYQVKAMLIRVSLGFLLLFLGTQARGQDVRVNCSQVQACTLTPAGGLPWANA